MILSTLVEKREQYDFFHSKTINMRPNGSKLMMACWAEKSYTVRAAVANMAHYYVR